MKTPEFVLKAGGDKTDWVEDHDSLKEEVSNLPSNQIKWWKTNLKIRKALSEIREQVIEGLNSGSKLPLHIISENSLSKRARVARISVSHPARKPWITKELELIKREILKFRKAVQGEDQQLSGLQNQLIKARQETFVWYSKVLKLEEEKKSLEKIISTLKRNLNSKIEPDNSRFLHPK